MSSRLIRVVRFTAAWLVVLSAGGCSVMAPPTQPPRAEPVVVIAPPAPEPEPVVRAEPLPPPVVVAPAPPPMAQPARPPVPSSVVPRIEQIPRGAPNAPYVVNGIRYAPYNRDVPMVESGIASWYGEPFHGRKTANGERYDMHTMTAAHKTMPLPSYAVVRNRTTGKEIIVRINDRGPFKPGRVIDLSYAAAQALGIDGLGNVEVVRLTNELIAQGTWRTMPSTRATVAKAEGPTKRR